MTDELPSGPQLVCPNCGRDAGEDAWCARCGLHLLEQPELPTADAYAAKHREEAWLAANSPAPATTLRVIAGKAAGREIRLNGEFLIGRGADTDEGKLGGDPEVSRSHARISRGAGDRLAIEDLGSRNGTFVNGTRIEGARLLEPGDRINVGTTTLEVISVAAQGTVSSSTRAEAPLDEQATTMASTPAPTPPPTPAPTMVPAAQPPPPMAPPPAEASPPWPIPVAAPSAPERPAVVPVPVPGAPGKPRNPGLVLLLVLLTANIYWVYWLYQTYKEVRSRAPSATTITPGQAAGFMFIPFFSFYWLVRLALDFPRAIWRMQVQDGLGEPALNRWLVTGLLVAGFFVNLLSVFDLVFLVVGELMFLSAFFISQRALNDHWERLGVPQAASLEIVGAAVAAAGGLLLLGSLFLPWLDFPLTTFRTNSLTGWETFSHIDILLAVLAVGIGALALVGLLSNEPAPFLIAAIMAIIAFGLTLPDGGDHVRVGEYIAPVGPVLAVLGALIVLSSPKRGATGARPSGPPPAPA